MHQGRDNYGNSRHNCQFVTTTARSMPILPLPKGNADLFRRTCRSRAVKYSPLSLWQNGNQACQPFECARSKSPFWQKKISVLPKSDSLFASNRAILLLIKLFFLAQELPLKKGADVRFAGFHVRVVFYDGSGWPSFKMARHLKTTCEIQSSYELV